MRFKCAQGHLHKTSAAAANCRFCRRFKKRQLEKYMAAARVEGELALARLRVERRAGVA